MNEMVMVTPVHEMVVDHSCTLDGDNPVCALDDDDHPCVFYLVMITLV